MHWWDLHNYWSWYFSNTDSFEFVLGKRSQNFFIVFIYSLHQSTTPSLTKSALLHLLHSPLIILGTILSTKDKTYFKMTGWISRIFAQARKLSGCLSSKITRYKLRCPLNRSTVTDVSPESWYTLVNEESCNLGSPATFTLPMRESRSPTAWPRVGEKTGSNTNCRKLQFSRDLSTWQKKRKMW